MMKIACPLLTTLLLLVAHTSPAHAGCLDAPAATTRLSQADRQLLDFFAQQASRDQVPVMQQYNQGNSSNQAILGNYARLRLAALALQGGDSQFARQQLSQVEQNSPAAVDAALLLAESYRRDGDQERARGWFMRIAARFPGSPRAVSGLILAGDDMRRQGNASLALPLYNLAQMKAEENIQALAELAANPDRLYRTLTNTVAGNSTTVMDQLVLAMIRDSHSQVLPATRQLVEAQQQRRCLKAEEEPLRKAMDQAVSRDLSNSGFRTAAQMEKKAAEQEITDLQRILAQAPDTPELQERLQEAQSRLDNLNNRLSMLSSTAVPPQLQARQQQLIDDKAKVEKNVQQARQQVRQALHDQLPAMKKFYRNLTAEAQLGKAQLLQGS